MTFLELLKQASLPEKIYPIFKELYESYSQSVIQSGGSMDVYNIHFETLLRLVQEQLKNPYLFEPYHRKITHPFNYFQFGVDFIRPLVDQRRSRVLHLDHVGQMAQHLKKRENVILFSNHQTEVDPQLIAIALEESYPEIGKNMIFVAGDRVITDPMAIPFSKGCNLLCIYSKRYIHVPPEKKSEKQLHNQKTMKKMQELLSEGGYCIYVAPSGGRDRPNEQGEVVVAPFDPQSIEMFRLIADHAARPTHFYTLALATYHILPPPNEIQSELGEQRKIKREGIYFSFGAEVDMENFPCELSPSQLTDRHAKRIARAHYLWNVVRSDYHTLTL